ncbi:MAG: hypothetical protein IPJ34_17220 [Myxococcales bacterium]|nr:hypothetical protein [Myxococcales bacterium]
MRRQRGAARRRADGRGHRRLGGQARAHNANNSDSDTLDHLDLRAVAQFSRRLASFAQVALNHIEVIEIEQAELWGDAGAVAAE